MIKPLADRVLIEPKEAETKTASGIYLPDTAKEKPQQGTVLAVGPGKKDEPMEQGVVYPVDYEIQPTARIWHKGETLRLQISADFKLNEWYEDCRMKFVVDNGEKGEAKHVIHTGGQYDSYLQIPTIPPKYTAGEYVYRG